MGLKLILLVNIWLAMFAGLEGIGSGTAKENGNLKTQNGTRETPIGEHKKEFKTARYIVKDLVTAEKGQKIVCLTIIRLTKAGDVFTAKYLQIIADGTPEGAWDECTLKYTNLDGKPAIKEAPVCKKWLGKRIFKRKSRGKKHNKDGEHTKGKDSKGKVRKDSESTHDKGKVSKDSKGTHGKNENKK